MNFCKRKVCSSSINIEKKHFNERKEYSSKKEIISNILKNIFNVIEGDQEYYIHMCDCKIYKNKCILKKEPNIWMGNYTSTINKLYNKSFDKSYNKSYNNVLIDIKPNEYSIVFRKKNDDKISDLLFSGYQTYYVSKSLFYKLYKILIKKGFIEVNHAFL